MESLCIKASIRKDFFSQRGMRRAISLSREDFFINSDEAIQKPDHKGRLQVVLLCVLKGLTKRMIHFSPPVKRLLYLRDMSS